MQQSQLTMRSKIQNLCCKMHQYTVAKQNNITETAHLHALRTHILSLDLQNNWNGNEFLPFSFFSPKSYR